MCSSDLPGSCRGGSDRSDSDAPSGHDGSTGVRPRRIAAEVAHVARLGRRRGRGRYHFQTDVPVESGWRVTAGVTMAAGLFESTQHAGLHDEGLPGDDSYRAISGVTVAAGVLAVVSPLAFLDWWLLVVPLFGMVLGGIGLRDILRRPAELTGRGIAVAAMVVSALAAAGGLGYQSYV